MPMKTTHAEGYAYGSISDVSFNNNNNSSNNSSNNNNDHRSNVERLGHCSNMEGHHHSSFYSRQRHLSVEDSPVKEIKEGVSSESFPNGYALTLIFLCVFIGDMARGILFPTLWLFVQEMGGNRMHQGIVVASFSLGRIISSPLLGTVSELYGYIPVLVISNTIICIGCFGYSLSNTIPMVVCAQVVIGFGSGTLGVTRSYIAENFSRKDRSEYMAYLTAVQYAGFTVTPLVGSSVSYLGYHYPVTTDMMYIDEFSVPALFMGGLAALLAVAFASYDVVAYLNFNKRIPFSVPRAVKEASHKSTPHENERLLHSTNENESVDEIQDREVLYHDCKDAHDLRTKLILGGMALNVFTKGTIGVFETLGSEYATSLIAFSSQTTGYVFSLLGACGAIALLFFSRLVRFYDEVQLCIGGAYLMIFSCVLMSILPFNVTMFVDPETTVHHAIYSKQIAFVFVVAVFSMYATGYPIGHTSLLCLFSKIQKNGPQGALLGWFGFSGSLARVAFPLTAGIIAQYSGGGDTAVFLLLAFIMCVALCLVLRFQETIRAKCDIHSQH